MFVRKNWQMERVKVKILLIIFLLACQLGMLITFPVHAQEEAPRALVLTVDGAITATTAEYLERGLRYAEQEEYQLIILQLNTPGGSVDITNRIVQIMRGSPIPFVVYVTPRGAMAGSAGTVITMAGHVAAMAPETVIGAASPVGPQGEDVGETLERKSKEILKALMRTLVERRGKEAVALAEDTIENAKAVSAEEALKIGLVDFIAEDMNDLLRQLDGFTVKTSAGEIALQTASMMTEPFKNTVVEQVLMLLTNPNVVFLLMTIGVQAILIELSSPGGWVAGFIGVIALSLAIYGLGVLPVNWFGLIFIIMAFVLFLLDLKAPTHGALTAAGIGSFIAGTLILFNSARTPQFQRVSPALVVAVGILTGLTFAVAVGFALRAQRVPIRTGHESLIGRSGTVRVPLAPRGQVHIGGESWSAESINGEEIPAGARVEVVEVDGLHLRVRRRE